MVVGSDCSPLVLAVIVVVPGVSPTTSPLGATEATAGLALVQANVSGVGSDDPSSRNPRAANDTDSPRWTNVEGAGVISIRDSWPSLTFTTTSSKLSSNASVAVSRSV